MGRGRARARRGRGARGRRRRRRRSRAASCGTVTLNEQAWAGSTANTYVAKNVLESIGCKVNITQIAEIPVYQAMADGKTDAVLEDWQHVDQYKQYITKQQTAVLGGPNGVNGHIGWYIPDVPDEAAPAVQDVEGAEGQGVALQEPGVRLAGDVPRRRPVLRAEGPAADQGARAELQVRQRRRRAGAGRALDAARTSSTSRCSSTGTPAVPERAVPARRGASCRRASRAARTTQKPGGDVEAVRVRVRHLSTRQVLQREVREERLARLRRC